MYETVDSKLPFSPDLPLLLFACRNAAKANNSL